MAKISLPIPADLKQKLDNLADARRTPLASILRTWIADAYERAPDKGEVSR